MSHSIIQCTFHVRIKHIIISQNSAFVCTLCFCFEWTCLDPCFNKLLIISELFRWCQGFLGRVEYAISDSESVCLHFEVWWSHPMRRCERKTGEDGALSRSEWIIFSCVLYYLLKLTVCDIMYVVVFKKYNKSTFVINLCLGRHFSKMIWFLLSEHEIFSQSVLYETHECESVDALWCWLLLYLSRNKLKRQCLIYIIINKKSLKIVHTYTKPNLQCCQREINMHLLNIWSCLCDANVKRIDFSCRFAVHKCIYLSSFLDLLWNRQLLSKKHCCIIDKWFHINMICHVHTLC